MGRFFPVYRLGEDGDLKNEGGGMILVWAIRARSYKTRAEAWQQGQSPPYSPRGFSGLCLMAQVTTGLIRSIRPIRSIRGKRIIVYPLAYCPPGRGMVVGYLYPRAMPPVTHGSAFQAPECMRGTPKHPEGVAGS